MELLHWRQMRSVWTNVHGRRVHARTAGTASDQPPIVLVHGMVISSRYFAPLAGLLARARLVVAVDLPGHGLSDKPHRALSIPELADALAAWMEAAEVAPADVIGNSAGCQVLAHLGARYPKHVRRMVMAGPTVDPDNHSTTQQVGRWLLNGRLEQPSMGLVLVRDYAQAGLRQAVGEFRAIMADHIEAILPHVHAPTMVVRGTRDPIVPMRWAEEAVRLLPNGTLRVIPGATHTLNHAAPLELARVARPFLADGFPTLEAA